MADDCRVYVGLACVHVDPFGADTYEVRFFDADGNCSTTLEVLPDRTLHLAPEEDFPMSDRSRQEPERRGPQRWTVLSASMAADEDRGAAPPTRVVAEEDYDALEARVKQVADQLEFYGCMTGDCDHERYDHCAEPLRLEAQAAVDSLRAALSGDEPSATGAADRRDS